MTRPTRVAVVTGGSRGIGRETCLVLAEAGYMVIVNYRSNTEAAHDTVAAIVNAGGKAISVQADIASEEDISGLFRRADDIGPLSLLVNNAGVVDYAQRVDEMHAARLSRMMTINVVGTFLCAGQAVKRMSTRHGGKGGVIVNLSSVAARIGSPGEYVDYAASKGAIDTFIIGLAREVAGEGIRVAAVSPGLIETEIHASGGQPDRLVCLAGTVPMKRAGTAREVAEAVAWLASPQASYVTGAILNVSGGRG